METNSELSATKLFESAGKCLAPSASALIALACAHESAAIRGDDFAIPSAQTCYVSAMDMLHRCRLRIPHQLWNNLGVLKLAMGERFQACAAFVAAVRAVSTAQNITLSCTASYTQFRVLTLAALKASQAKPSRYTASMISIATNVTEVFVREGSLIAAQEIAEAILSLRPTNLKSILNLATACFGKRKKEGCNMTRNAFNILCDLSVGDVVNVSNPKYPSYQSDLDKNEQIASVRYDDIQLISKYIANTAGMDGLLALLPYLRKFGDGKLCSSYVIIFCSYILHLSNGNQLQLIVAFQLIIDCVRAATQEREDLVPFWPVELEVIKSVKACFLISPSCASVRKQESCIILNNVVIVVDASERSLGMAKRKSAEASNAFCIYSIILCCPHDDLDDQAGILIGTLLANANKFASASKVLEHITDNLLSPSCFMVKAHVNDKEANTGEIIRIDKAMYKAESHEGDP